MSLWHHITNCVHIDWFSVPCKIHFANSAPSEVDAHMDQGPDLQRILREP